MTWLEERSHNQANNIYSDILQQHSHSLKNHICEKKISYHMEMTGTNLYDNLF